MLKGWATPLILLLSFHLFAQEQGHIWYFGRNAGLDFNSGPPVALIDGALNTNEGCATICDANGSLLFYTDGVTVYTKTHQIMLNGTGLLGHSSSTQSAIIVPWPEKDSLYYIITADAIDNSGASGYNYSIININKDGGKGEVILKNQKLYSPSTEKLTVAKHNNDLDWWVITRQVGNNQFNVYLIDKEGIHANPVISKTGSTITMSQSAGSMRISPDNKKLAVAYTSASYFELYDFDNEKGTLHNPIEISNQLPYGLAFSPNSKMLYVSTTLSNNGKISQYDISTATDPISIAATRTNITPATSTQLPFGLQLGPDNKIYVNYSSNAIAVIHEPDNKGMACRLEENAIDLKGRKPGIMFPAILPKKQPPPVNFTIDAIITITDTCKREVQFEAVSNQMTNITYKWNLNMAGSSTIYNPKATFPHITNAFLIELEVEADVLTANGQQRQTKLYSKWIQFEPLPEANAGKDAVVVAGTPFQLKGSGGTTYQWEPGQFLTNASIADPIADLQRDQLFTLTASNAAGCTDTDNVYVRVVKEIRIHVPTAFSPNKDGKNDVLHAFPAGVQMKSFTIYNRWGNIVFATTDPAKGWDGYYKDKLQPAGVYVWTAEAIDSNERTIQYKGSVYLMR